MTEFDDLPRPMSQDDLRHVHRTVGAGPSGSVGCSSCCAETLVRSVPRCLPRSKPPLGAGSESVRPVEGHDAAVDVRPLLAQLEDEPEPRPALAYVASRDVELDPDELRGALRRALLLLAAGGDPRRMLDPEARAVRAVASDLVTPERRAALTGALDRLRGDADGLPRVDAALEALVAHPDAGWRWLAIALLADELTGDGD